MKEKLFTVYDNVNCSLYLVGTANTAGAFIRNLGQFFRVGSIDDYSLYEVGEIDDSGRGFVTHSPVLLSWEEYKKPETIAKDLSEATK